MRYRKRCLIFGVVEKKGVPIWAVYTLTLDGDTMKVALTLEPSRTVKRGTGKKKGD
jgi:hypothetical protein